jgi:uncharacterized alkaline shock family protein YloU
MTIFNRLFSSVILLLLLALAVGAVGLATGLLTEHSVDRVHAYPPLHQALRDLSTAHTQQARILKVVVPGVVGLIALLLLFAELRPPGRERTLRLVENQDGEVAIGYNTVRKVAELASLDISGVQRARCQVTRDKESLRVRCRATVDQYANAAVVGGQVEAAIKQHLEQTLGRPVERVSVRIERQSAKAPVRVR